jgi:hypothetical protein
MYAYYDPEADEVGDMEIWGASRRLPKAIPDALPAPGRQRDAAA